MPCTFEHVGYQASGLELSGEILLATYMGGIGHFLGPIVGAVLFTFSKGGVERSQFGLVSVFGNCFPA